MRVIMFFVLMIRFVKLETENILSYPAPINQFIEKIFSENKKFSISFTKVKEARNNLVESMKILGYPEIARI